MNPRLLSSYFTAGDLAPDLDIKPLQAHTYFDLIRETKRSLLQACSSNAKFTFDRREGRSYTKITGKFWARRTHSNIQRRERTATGN